MRTYRDLSDINQHISVAYGQHRKVDVNLCAVVRDEMFFMPAFFDYYRKLGVQQFIILDDGSVDGTVEFLRAQPDCVVLASTLRFGEAVSVTFPDGTKFAERADPLLKCVIPRMFCPGQYALSVDGDEFLILPREIPSLRDAFSALAKAGIRCAMANMIEFYPKDFRGLKGEVHPKSFADILGLYPFFDAAPLLELRSGEQPTIVRSSVTHRVFYTPKPEPTGVLPSLRRWLGHQESVSKSKPRKFIRVEKVPIVRWGEDVWLNGNHATNLTPSDAVLLALAHFKFTHDFVARARRAVEWNAHAGKTGKYRTYVEALDTMRRRDFSFECDETETYTGPDQLKRNGLLKWELAS